MDADVPQASFLEQRTFIVIPDWIGHLGTAQETEVNASLAYFLKNKNGQKSIRFNLDLSESFRPF